MLTLSVKITAKYDFERSPFKIILDVPLLIFSHLGSGRWTAKSQGCPQLNWLPPPPALNLLSNPPRRQKGWVTFALSNLFMRSVFGDRL